MENFKVCFRLKDCNAHLIHMNGTLRCVRGPPLKISSSPLCRNTDHKDLLATTDLYPKATTADREKNALVKRIESVEKDVAAANKATNKAN